MDSPETPDDIINPAPSRRNFVMRGAALGIGVAVAGAAAWARTKAEHPMSDAASSAPARAIVPNRAPLQPTPFTALPLGSVRAKGWLLTQLELQRDGLTGRAEELLPALAPDSGWLGGKGEDWEKGPYYVKGLVALAYGLDDPALKARAQKWVDAILSHGREDGYFGPTTNGEWWPRMIATYLLRDYAEATGDARVVPFLTRYYRYMSANLPKKPLQEWAKARAGDEIDTVFWLYNRTGEAFLLELSDLLVKQAYPWQDILTHNRFLDFGQDFHPKHNVNVPQAMKLPPVYWQRSHDPADRAAFALGVQNLDRDHGLAVGINSGTEFLAGRSAAQGIELCSIVERMLSDETALRILGDAAIGDNLEQMAYNALPAALTKNIHQHVYFTVPNNPTAPRGKVGYIQDYEDARTPAPISGFPCCCYNFHMGWPKFAQNAWAATREGGLAVMAYAPSEVTATVGGGATVRITQTTDYPFEETVRLQVHTAKKVRFPLALRIPAWCAKPAIAVNGTPQPAPKPETFATVAREWNDGDVVTIHLPMAVRTVPGVNNSVSVWRGPLLYSLEIGQHWEIVEKGKVEGFDALTVTPSTDWNFGLVLDAPGQGAFSVEHRPVPHNPFEPSQTPTRLHVGAKRVADWTLTRSGHIALDPPVSPVSSPAPTQQVTLVPFGAQMLRVANFPVIGPPRPLTTRFADNFASGHADGWVTYGGGWIVRKGAFGPTGDMTATKAVATATRFRDFAYDADVTVSENGDAGLMFRVTQASNGADDYDGYYVGLSASAGRVTVGKAGGDWHPLKEAMRPIAANRSQHVRVEARGPLLRVFVEDMATPLLEVTDATFTEGAIGVRQYGTKSEQAQSAFARIKVVGLG